MTAEQEWRNVAPFRQVAECTAELGHELVKLLPAVGFEVLVLKQIVHPERISQDRGGGHSGCPLDWQTVAVCRLPARSGHLLALNGERRSGGVPSLARRRFSWQQEARSPRSAFSENTDRRSGQHA